MGTRSTTHWYDGSKHVANKLVSTYKQYDGYPSGFGQELYAFLKPYTIVNGFGSNTPEVAANGMGCLAAQAIKHFKDGIGGFYITNPKDSQEYDYHIYLTESELRVWVVDDGKRAFDGNLEEYLEWLNADINQ